MQGRYLLTEDISLPFFSTLNRKQGSQLAGQRPGSDGGPEADEGGRGGDRAAGDGQVQRRHPVLVGPVQVPASSQAPCHFIPGDKDSPAPMRRAMSSGEPCSAA